MRRIIALTLALAALTAGAALAQNPLPPVAVTGAASAIGLNGATVAGTVDPNASATTWHVDYGTTSGYGLSTPERSAGAGATPVAVTQPLTGLTSATTYHYRLVATNAAGVARGADRSFKTTAPPSPPGVSTGGVRSITTTGGTLTGTVSQRGLAGAYHFEYGPTSALGTSTAEVAFAAGTKVAASTAVGGLRPGTRYSYRLVAHTATGTTRGSVRSFVTKNGPASMTISAAPAITIFGAGTQISGRLTGGVTRNVQVSLQRTRFPFSERFATVAGGRSGNDGSFTFATGPVFAATRFRVVAGGVASQVVTVRCRVKVGIVIRRRPGRRLRIFGAIAPGATASWRVSLQRQSPTGRWVRIKRLATTPLRGNRSRYRTTTVRPRGGRPALYRVVVTPRGDPAWVRGFSRGVAVARR